MSTITRISRPIVRLVPDHRPPPFVGLGTRILYDQLYEWGMRDPLWEVRIMMLWDGRFLSTTPDCIWPAERIAVYLDGGYHLDPAQADADRLRRNWLQRAGWIVLVYSNYRLQHDPLGIMAELEGALSDRGDELERAA